MPEDEKAEPIQRAYTNEAAIRMVNLIFDPDDKNLLSLCRIRTTREAFTLAMQITKEATLMERKDSKGNRVPLSKYWRNAYLMLTRSIDMKAFLMGVGLAHGQAEDEADKIGEEAEF
jgi:hypothetical protein